ncbi:MAG: electron transfer flavoprotein subunit alpha/FixB family protein [Thermodesulfobacteriota bacterium]
MARTGILLETDNGEVKAANYGVITAARETGNNEVVGFLMDGSAEAGKAAVQEYGVTSVIEIKAEAGDFKGSPELQANALADALKHYEISALLGLSSTQGRDLMARVAAAMDVPLVLDCVGVTVRDQTVTKSHFSGKTIAKIELEGDVFLCGIRPNAIEPVASAAEATTDVYTASAGDSGRLKVVETKGATSGEIELTEANVIITGGRPIASAENFDILKSCAQELGAAVGASRAAVDAGYAPHAMQVGQTGKTVSPKLYIGCGLSGSVQHFAGMKTSKIIVAINTDKDAPIFTKCDYGILGDLFDVVPALTEVLKEQG